MARRLRAHRAGLRPLSRPARSARAMTSVAVLGAGAWGTALACHLAARAARAPPSTLWAREPAQAARLSRVARENARYLPGSRCRRRCASPRTSPTRPRARRCCSSRRPWPRCPTARPRCAARRRRAPLDVAGQGIRRRRRTLPPAWPHAPGARATLARAGGRRVRPELRRGGGAGAADRARRGGDRRRRWPPAWPRCCAANAARLRDATISPAWRWAARSRTCWPSPPAPATAWASATTPARR